MLTIVLEVPDALLEQAGGSLRELTAEVKALLAIKYFELGRLNFGQAVALSGMDRPDFLALAKQAGLAAGDWQEI